MVTTQDLIQRVGEIRRDIAHHIARSGVNPRPELNAVFSRLLGLVQTPLTPQKANQVIQKLSTPEKLPDLQHLRDMCWQCEMAMERDTAAKVIYDFNAMGAFAPEKSSVEDKIRRFETITQRHYPHPWGGLREALNIQKLLDLKEVDDVDMLFCGTSALPYSRFYWVWAAELEQRNLTMTSVDDDPVSRMLGSDFLTLGENFGLVAPSVLSMTGEVPLQPSKFTAAHVIQYPRARQKEDIIIDLLNSGIGKVSFTYPEGLVQLLYEPVDMQRIISATQARLTGCLLSHFANEPYFPTVTICKPEKNDALWLSTYVLEKEI